jgi:rod shape-determining protein MreD
MDYSEPRRIEEILLREIGLFCSLLVIVVLQTSFLPSFLQISSNLVLVFTICQALLFGAPTAARWAFYGGLLLDLLGNSFLGSHTLALAVAVVIPPILFSRLNRENWILPIIGVGLGALLYYSVFGLYLHVFVAPVNLNFYFLLVLFPGTLNALIPSLPIYLLLRWIEMRRQG